MQNYEVDVIAIGAKWVRANSPKEASKSIDASDAIEISHIMVYDEETGEEWRFDRD